MDIQAYFPVQGQSGWEFICRNLLIELHKLGVRVNLNVKNTWNLELTELDQEDSDRLVDMTKTQISETSAVLFQQVPKDEEIKHYQMAEKKVCLSLFETDKVSQRWAEQFKKIDEVWTFTDFNYNDWKPDVPNIKKIPFAIDTKVYNPEVSPAKIENKKAFTFITNGDLTERKNFEVLIQAFTEEFNSDEDVCLVIKTHSRGFTIQFKRIVLDILKQIVKDFAPKDKKLPKILFFGDKIPVASMPSFYRSGDCLVLPSRGEGLGIPLAEALSCEVPVIAPDKGGHTEFCKEDNSYLVKCEKSLVTNIEYISKSPDSANSNWLEVDKDDLKEKMRYVYQNKEEAKEKAKKGRELLKKFTFVKQALWVINNLYGESK